jgi:hypothetical protein
MVGQKMGGDADVERAIAEGCEAGKIAAAYRTVMGADELDPIVWRLPHWRNFFLTGTIDLDLPLLDERGRPNANGFIAPRCTREIFVRRDSLNRFVDELDPPAITRDKEPLRDAPEKEIRVEIRAVYRDAGNDPPNIRDLCKVVKPRLNARGLEASHRQIMEVGQQQEFDGLRRQPGKTKASERPK